MARRSGLGRGLEAILPPPGVDGAGSSDAAPDGDAGSPGVVEVAVGEVRANRYQPRQVFEEDALDDLAASIAMVGVLQPVLVRPVADGYELIAGERRWRAAQRAGLSHIPAVVRETEDQDALAQAVVENVQRADLNPIEEAAAYQQLLEEFGHTQEAVAQQVGRSRAAVANTLRLLQLAPTIQRLLLDGMLTAGHGRALLTVADEEAREALATRVVAEDLSVRATEEAARRLEPAEEEPGPSTPGQTRPAALLELEELLSTRLSTRVHVHMSRRRGRIEIDFADLEDLERIFRLIS